MKLSPEIVASINQQMKAEYFSAALYRSLSAWMSAHGYTGACHWFKCQAAEETDHGNQLMDFLLATNSTPVFHPIEGPRTDWDNCLEAFEYALEHEKFVSNSILELLDKARIEKSHQCEPILLKFIAEQVEEEEQAQAIVDRLTLAQGDIAATLLIDQELGKR